MRKTMQPKKSVIEHARKTGRIDRINQLLSLAYLLHSKAYLLYDEADTIMRECGLCIGHTKALSTQLSKMYERYMKDFSQMINSQENKMGYFADLEDFGHLVHKWAKVEEDWKPTIS